MRLLYISILKKGDIWKYTLLFISLIACISPFEPEIDKYENLLVVDGAISNIPGSAYVRLNRTSPYNNRNKNPVNDARITLIDDIENKILFSNPKPGYYLLTDSSFAGLIGRRYKIRIETADGEICESLFEELKEPIPIDNIKFEFIRGSNDKEQGIEIQIDVNNQYNRQAFFSWEYTETWEYRVPYTSPKAPNSRVCYRTISSPKFLIKSTQDLVKKELLNYPLYFIDNTTNRLYIRYSVLIIQHILSEQTYTYYDNLKKLNEDQGSLFDNSPVTLIGNMRNLLSTDQPILGNFQVTGASTKRFFIESNDVIKEFIPPDGYDAICGHFEGGWKYNAAILDSLFSAGWVIMDTKYNTTKQDSIFYLTNSIFCYDCKKTGSTIQPDFWIEGFFH